MPKKTAPAPLTHRQLKNRPSIRPKGKPKRATTSLLDVSLDGVRQPRLVMKEGRLSVVASIDGKGIRQERRYERIPTTRLKLKTLDPNLSTRELQGFRPSGVATTFVPKLGKPTHQLRAGRGKGLDRGGSIFGADDRYLFDDHAFPWSTTGKVRTVGKWGSGTTIGPRHVLTAS